MLIAIAVVAAALACCFAFVLFMRWAGRKCTRQYQVGGEGSVNVQAGRDVQQ